MMAKQTLPKPEGKSLPSQVYSCRVTYHPGSVLAGGFQYERRIEEDFKRMRTEVVEAPRNKLPPVVSGAMVGFDTEYDANAVLLTVGVADTKYAFAQETPFKEVKAVLKKAKVLCGHSITGDLDYLVRLGLARDKWLRGLDVKDSFLLARMHDENRGKGGYGLETLLLSEVNAHGWKSVTDALIKKTGNAADWTPEQRVERCRMDAWATLLLTKLFEEKLEEQLL